MKVLPLAISSSTTDTGMGPNPSISHSSPSLGTPRSRVSRSTRIMIFAGLLANFLLRRCFEGGVASLITDVSRGEGGDGGGGEGWVGGEGAGGEGRGDGGRGGDAV